MPSGWIAFWKICLVIGPPAVCQNRIFTLPNTFAQLFGRLVNVSIGELLQRLAAGSGEQFLQCGAEQDFQRSEFIL
jgi:hypothetical protein